VGAVPPVSFAASLEAPRVERTAEKKYDLDFKSASLINVLNVLSNLSGMNFVAGREVADRQVNMTLDKAGLDDVLQSLAYGCNVTYDFIPGKNIYVFRAAADSPERPPLLTRVFKLYYLNAARRGQGDASWGASAQGSAGASSETLSGGFSGNELVTFQVDEGDDGLESAAIYKAVEKILSERGQVSADDRSNSLIVTDTEDRLKMIEATIAQLDQPLDQVLMNVLLVETFEDLDRDLGVEWGGTKGVLGAIPAEDRDFASFLARIKALESSSKLRILAKPRVLTLDHHPVLIKVATQAAIGESLSSSETGTASIRQTERAQIGTVLSMTPQINTGGRITLEVEPTFATVAPSLIPVKSSGSGATGDPTVRTARTTMMVHEGQTAVLGGMLLGPRMNEEGSGSTRGREMILFVTPYIISAPALESSQQEPQEASSVTRH